MVLLSLLPDKSDWRNKNKWEKSKHKTKIWKISTYTSQLYNIIFTSHVNKNNINHEPITDITDYSAYTDTHERVSGKY